MPITTPPVPNISESITSRNRRLFRELNDIHIFISKVTPRIRSLVHKYSRYDDEYDRRLKVPGKTGDQSITKRNPEELSDLIKRFNTTELYQNFLVSIVSKFESYLADIIAIFLINSIEKLSIGPNGGESGKQLPVQMVIDHTSIEALRNALIEMRLQSIFYAKPKEYCKYFREISDLGISDSQFTKFFEIKATRDVVTHNSCIINSLYIEKAGPLARGNLGENLSVDRQYFEECISVLKKLSAEIESATRVKYSPVT